MIPIEQAPKKHYTLIIVSNIWAFFSIIFFVPKKASMGSSHIHLLICIYAYPGIY